MAKTTILQIVPRLDTGGSEQSAVEIAGALTRAGAFSLVATEGGRLAAAVTAAGGEIVTLPVASKNPFTMFTNARRIERLIEERQVDLVHARSRAPAWSGLLAARRTRRPFVTTYHGAYGTPGPLKSVYNSVMSRGDLVIANSLYTASLITARHSGATARMRIIYRGIDPSKFTPAAIAPDRLQRLMAEWGVRQGQPVVLQAARLSSWKGQRVVIEAAQRLSREKQLGEAVFVLAGDAQGREAYRSALEQLVADSGLSDRVRLVGHCSDMPAAFAIAKVGIVASTAAETFGRTSVEAQAAGCPVIVSNIGALPETVISPDQDKAGFTGWLVPPGDVAALAGRLRVALGLSSAERAAIGARARARASTEFALSQMQMQTLAVYDELLGTHLAQAFAHPPALEAASIRDRA